MRILSRAGRICRASALPVRARLRLLEIAILRRLIRPKEFRVDLKHGTAFLSSDSIIFDYAAFGEVFVNECYKTDYQGATVVDVGAHRGYYGAYALMKGAKQVFSFEPEKQNYGHLQKTAESFRARGHLWTIERTAIGSSDGELSLYVSDRSWSHSVLERSDVAVIGEERVKVRSFSPVLKQLKESPSGGPLVIKINIEGAECDVILGTPSELWNAVDEVFVEFEPFAPCKFADLLAHLAAGGLSLSPRVNGGAYHLTRLKVDS